jgi:hypothetical protein
MSPLVLSFSERCGCTTTRSPHTAISAPSRAADCDGDAPTAASPSSLAHDARLAGLAAAGVGVSASVGS